jgi:hypothetical protein
MSEQTLTDEEIERKQAKFKKEIDKLREAIRLQYKMIKEQALKAAEALEKSGTVEARMIAMEIIKQLRPEIENELVSVRTIYTWLPDKYKQLPGHGRGSARMHWFPGKDLPTLEVELIEKVSGLDFQHVRQMSINEFIQKYREIYLHTLQTMSDDEIHYQALILDYLYPMARDMLEITEKHRAEIKKKSEMLSK